MWAEDQDWYGLEELINDDLFHYEGLKTIQKVVKTNTWVIQETIVWETKNGELLNITDMETDHIKNCVKVIKEHNWRRVYLPIFIQELKDRGEWNN